MKKSELSIIVPCYNAEKYVEKFFQQIKSQTFQDFELIIIDDCSKDATYTLLKNHQNDKIKVFRNNQNIGAGETRNRGIKISQGKYLAFVDADDRFPENYFDVLYQCIKKEDYDMVVCKIKAFDGTEIDYPNNTLSKKEILESPYSAAVWGKILKKDLIKKNPFPKGIINEDIPAIIGVILDSNFIGYTNKTFYEYVCNQNSVQNSNFNVKKFDVFTALDLLKSRKNINEFREVLEYNQLIFFYLYMVLEISSYTDRKKYIKLFYEKYKNKISKNQYCKEVYKEKNLLIKIYYFLIINLGDNHLYTLVNIIVAIKKKLKS